MAGPPTSKQQYRGEERRSMSDHADDMVEALIKRYGITPHEVINVVRIVTSWEQTLRNVKNTAIAVLVTTIVGALVLAFWNAVKRGDLL